MMMYGENNLTHGLRATNSSVPQMRNDLEAQGIMADVNLHKGIHQLQKAIPALAQSATHTELIIPQFLCV